MDGFLYNELNKAWKTTCKVLFKEEIGELKEYEGWLKTIIKDVPKRKGLRVFPDYYSNESEFIEYKSIDFMKRFEPLNINEIKDIDSIVEALKERFVYAGNIVLGKSQFVENSTNVFDSFYVYESYGVEESKYIYNSAMLKESNYIFSSSVAPQSSYSVASITTPISNRIFASLYIVSSSDVYYSSKINNSVEVMFSSGIMNKNYVIGNMVLARDKYNEIKKALLEQMREILEKNKKIFDLIDLINEMDEPEIKFEYREEETKKAENKEIIENSFSKTTQIVLKKELKVIDEYSGFLEKNIPCEIWDEKLWRTSFISGKKTYIAAFAYISSRKEINGKRFFKFQEKPLIAGNHLNEEEISRISMEKENLKSILKNIMFASFEDEIGHNINIIDSNVINSSQNCYRGTTWIFNRNSAFCFWPRESEYVFGSAEIFNSSFAINAYYSNNIQRAFEVDNVQNSSDVYFSHNVENVIEGMFNFNVKNLSYAIGNAKYDPETYRRIKSSLLEQIGEELERKKDLKWSIYNIGAD